MTIEPNVLPRVEKGDVNASNAIQHSWKNWWTIPFGLSLLITSLGATWLYQGWIARHYGFGFWMAWIPFSLGIAGMAVSWRARVSRWVHLRARNSSGSRLSSIHISFPLPTRLIKWVFRKFGTFFPNEIRGYNLDDFMDALECTVNDETPIYIGLDDDKENQQVEIWIGGQ